MNYIKKTETQGSGVRAIALIGAANSGKTWAAATFPNPLFVDFDKKLPRHLTTPVSSLPFWDEVFLAEVIKEEKLAASTKIGGIVASSHVFLAWITKVAPSIPEDVTLVIDSWTMMQQLLDRVLNATKKQNSAGEVDTREYYARKATLSTEVLAALKNLKCQHVVIFHESKDMKSDGSPSGKLNPLMAGSLKESLPQNFTHWIRQTAEENKTTKEIEYLWQIKPNNECNCNCPEPHLLAQPKLMKVKAHYDSLLPNV